MPPGDRYPLVLTSESGKRGEMSEIIARASTIVPVHLRGTDVADSVRVNARRIVFPIASLPKFYVCNTRIT